MQDVGHSESLPCAHRLDDLCEKVTTNAFDFIFRILSFYFKRKRKT